MRKLFVYVSGVSHGNPGEAAVGIILTDEQGHVVEEVAQLIGRTTTRVAEYKALIEGTRKAIAYAPDEAVFLTDSPAVVNQINGISQPREPHLQYLNQQALELLGQLEKWRVNYIDREANGAANRLAERAFRERMKSERERAKTIRDIEASLQGLSLEELRKLQAFLQRLKARTT